MHQQGMNEISIAKFLNSKQTHYHVVRIYHHFVFRGHICAVFEPLGPSLYQVLETRHFLPLPPADVKSIGRQILQALEFCHSQGIVHCDVKPENVNLVTESGIDIRLIDFGTACRIGQNRFDYIQSRYYRSPEVILGMAYGPAVDIWSFGCLMAELAMGTALFEGSSELHQLNLYIQAIGEPPAALIRKAPRKSVLFSPDGKPKGGLLAPRSIEAQTGIKDRNLLELLMRCFAWDPGARISAADALQLPYFTAGAKPPKPSAVRAVKSATLSPRRFNHHPAVRP
jgi:dual specificity tyrosine-phosphorylation-regulated kinase 2/3/4